jgi:hypothetical protein
MGYYVEKLDYTAEELEADIQFWLKKANHASKQLERGPSPHWFRVRVEARCMADKLQRELEELNPANSNSQKRIKRSNVSRAKPDAKYQAYFENGPLSGWVVHINGQFKRIFATDSKAIAWAEEHSEQVTIDTRG